MALKIIRKLKLDNCKQYEEFYKNLNNNTKFPLINGVYQVVKRMKNYEK